MNTLNLPTSYALSSDTHPPTACSLAAFMSDAEVDFVLAAVRFVAAHGWKYLPQYSFYADSGEWKHRYRLDIVGICRFFIQICFSRFFKIFCRDIFDKQVFVFEASCFHTPVDDGWRPVTGRA